MAEAVLLNSHRQRVAAAMAGGAPLSPVAYMAFGNGGHNANNEAIAPNVDATALNNEVLRKPLASISQSDVFSTLGKGVVDVSELNDIAISEAALIDGSGQLIAIKTFAPKYKEPDERYEVSIKIRY